MPTTTFTRKRPVDQRSRLRKLAGQQKFAVHWQPATRHLRVPTVPDLLDVIEVGGEKVQKDTRLNTIETSDTSADQFFPKTLVKFRIQVKMKLTRKYQRKFKRKKSQMTRR
jgi:hypothetical protein